MASPPLVYIDRSTIRQGRFEVLQTAMKELSAFVEENMPRLISYGFYLDHSRAQMTVVAVHPDSASLVYHLDTSRSAFRKFADVIELQQIDVYGLVNGEVLDRLHDKAAALGGANVSVHELYAGFAR